MLAWGLDEAQQKLEPWGLASALLAPCKVITDEVWGDVHTNVLEQALIDTPPMQRLRRVRQLGNSHFVYPGATHTRFSHSLGALKVVNDLLGAVVTQHQGLHRVDDLLGQWKQDAPPLYERRIAEAIVLGRLGALLHDLCHVPFGHSIEDDLKVLVEHDKNAKRFDELWRQVNRSLPRKVERHLRKLEPEDVSAAVASLRFLFDIPGGDDPDAQRKSVAAQLRPLIISKDEHAGHLRRHDRIEYPFVEDLVGNTICADLLDYLLRDHLNTGLPASLGWRFTSGFFAVPEGRGPLSRRAALNIVRKQHERTDVISELLKALRYRYELSERVLYHHAKLSADAMIGKALDAWSDAVRLDEAAAEIAALPRAEDMVERHDVRGLLQELREQQDATAERRLQRSLRRRLEREFLAHGDDGLLERIAALRDERPEREPVAPLVAELYGHAAGLAEALLKRELFRIAGRVGLQGAPATALYQRYGAAEERIALEAAAQRFAEIGREPQVMLWLPDPKMRIKLAQVLVDDGRHINQFNFYEEARGGRGGDIYRADSNLWALWVFTRRDMKDDDREAVLVQLADRLGVAWEGLVEKYGTKSWTWMPRYGLARVLGIESPTDSAVDAVLAEAAQVSHRGVVKTRRAYMQRLRALPGVRASLAHADQPTTST